MRGVENDNAASFEAPAKIAARSPGRATDVQNSLRIDLNRLQPVHKAGRCFPVDEIRAVETCRRAIEATPQVPEPECAWL